MVLRLCLFVVAVGTVASGWEVRRGRRTLRVRRSGGERAPPTVLLSLGSEPPAGGEAIEINPDATYPGEPTIGSDGTEGNGAYYKGNYLPVGVATPKQHEKYWRDSPYWHYFKEVWGDAPMADANFELWLRGFFKDFTLPRHPQEGQTTRGLPAWLHYYSAKYDPLVDPPFLNDYALFATAEGAEAEEKARPEEAHDVVNVLAGGATIKGDCSEWGLTTIIDRPCTVRTAQRNAIQVFKQGKPRFFGGLDTRKWSGMRNMADKFTGKAKADGGDGGGGDGGGDEWDPNAVYFKTDKWWAKSIQTDAPSDRPQNFPVAPEERPPPPPPPGGEADPAGGGGDGGGGGDDDVPPLE